MSDLVRFEGASTNAVVWDGSDTYGQVEAICAGIVEADAWTNGWREEVGYGLWLLRGEVTPEQYAKRLSTLAETFGFSERTLRRWRLAAERARGLEPADDVSAAAKQREAKKAAVATVATTSDAPSETSAPVTRDDWRRWRARWRNHGAAAWATMLDDAEVDAEIEFWRSVRAERRKVGAITTSSACEHDWKQRKGGPLGVSYVCERCDDVSLQRPA